MTTLKQADPRGLLIDQTTFICSCSPFTPKVCRVCGTDTKHTTTQSWTRMNTSTHTVVWPFCPFVPNLKKRGGGRRESVLGNMTTLCYKCILPSLLAAQIQQDVTYTKLAGVRRLRITKIPPRNRQKPLCALNCCLIHWVCHTMKW